MPQLDLSTFPAQIIWLAITFFALYLVMARTALPRVGRILVEREERLADDLEQAEKLRGESETVLAEHETALDEARQNAKGHVREARDAVQKELDADRQKAEAKLNDQITKADARIAKARGKAMTSLESIAADACGAIVEKLAGEQVSAAAVKKVVKDRIAATDRKAD